MDSIWGKVDFIPFPWSRAPCSHMVRYYSEINSSTCNRPTQTELVASHVHPTTHCRSDLVFDLVVVVVMVMTVSMCVFRILLAHLSLIMAHARIVPYWQVDSSCYQNPGNDGSFPGVSAVSASVPPLDSTVVATKPLRPGGFDLLGVFVV